MDDNTKVILTFIVDKKDTSTRKICESFGFEKQKVKEIVEYLKLKYFIEYKTKLFNGDILSIKPLKNGIDYIESEKSGIKKLFKKFPKIEINFIKVG